MGNLQESDPNVCTAEAAARGNDREEMGAEGAPMLCSAPRPPFERFRDPGAQISPMAATTPVGHLGAAMESSAG